MAISMIIQVLIAVLPLLLKWLASNKRGDLMEIRARRVERILGMCGKCRSAGFQASFVPADNVQDDGTIIGEPDAGDGDKHG